MVPVIPKPGLRLLLVASALLGAAWTGKDVLYGKLESSLIFADSEELAASPLRSSLQRTMLLAGIFVVNETVNTTVVVPRVWPIERDGKLNKLRGARERATYQAKYKQQISRLPDVIQRIPPAWSMYPGDNIPRSFAIPKHGWPRVNVYIVNHQDKQLYMKNGETLYNIVPPKAVARQETFGNELWTVVDREKYVYAKFKVTRGNQLVSIDRPLDTMVPLSRADAAEMMYEANLKKLMPQQGADGKGKGD